MMCSWWNARLKQKPVIQKSQTLLKKWEVWTSSHGFSIRFLPKSMLAMHPTWATSIHVTVRGLVSTLTNNTGRRADKMKQHVLTQAFL